MVTVYSLLAVLAIHYSRIVNSFPQGAPPSQCLSMTPIHGPIGQQTPSPYSIQVSSVKVKPGEIIQVGLVTSGIPFKGFLALGSKVQDEVQLAGNMSPVLGEEGEEIQTVECPSGTTGITQSNPEPRTEVKFQWKAPDVAGEYVILATFVQHYHIFWVKQKSSIIVVEDTVVTSTTSTNNSNKHWFMPGLWAEVTILAVTVIWMADQQRR